MFEAQLKTDSGPTLQDLIRRVADTGGRIVCATELGAIAVAAARIDARLATTIDGNTYVYITDDPRSLGSVNSEVIDALLRRWEGRISEEQNPGYRAQTRRCAADLQGVLSGVPVAELDP